MSIEFNNGPQARVIENGFVEATEFMPQMPFAGRVRFTQDAVPMVGEGTATWGQLVGMSLEGEVGRDALRRTVASHQDSDVAPVPELARKMNFALELVQSGANQALAALARGDDSKHTREIGPVKNTETQIVVDFLREDANRQFIVDMMGAVSSRLKRRDVVRRLGRYKQKLAAISNQYKDVTPAQPDLMGEKERVKNRARDELIAFVAPRVMRTLQPFTRRRPGVRAFGEALLCGVPSQRLLRKHRMI